MSNENISKMETPQSLSSYSLDINQENDIYQLKLVLDNQNIIMTLSENDELHTEYELKLNLEELKLIHKIFLMFSSCQEFLELIKVLKEKNKIIIKKLNENEISIELTVEYLYQQNTIKFDLAKKIINFELIAKDIYKQLSLIKNDYKNLDIKYKKVIEKNKDLEKGNDNIKNEVKELKEENKDLKEQNNKIIQIIKTLQKDIDNLQEENNTINKKIKSIINKKKIKINSSIMNEEELNMIQTVINQRMNKEMKQIKKLYQAAIDGGYPSYFIKNVIISLIL